MRDELEATIEARRELGKAHEPELIEAFLDRIERRLDERSPQRPARQSGVSPALGVFSIVMAIPLTAVAATNSGTFAVVVVWIGLVLVNFAYYLRR
jgi:hypothetical protein